MLKVQMFPRRLDPLIQDIGSPTEFTMVHVVYVQGFEGESWKYKVVSKLSYCGLWVPGACR